MLDRAHSSTDKGRLRGRETEPRLVVIGYRVAQEADQTGSSPMMERENAEIREVSLSRYNGSFGIRVIGHTSAGIIKQTEREHAGVHVAHLSETSPAHAAGLEVSCGRHSYPTCPDGHKMCRVHGPQPTGKGGLEPVCAGTHPHSLFKVGDRIIAVNDEDVSAPAWTQERVLGLLKDSGETVHLKVVQDPDGLQRHRAAVEARQRMVGKGGWRLFSPAITPAYFGVHESQLKE